MTAHFTPVDDIAGIVATARKSFTEGRTKDIAWRRRTLERLKELLGQHEDDILAALKADLGKPRFEARFTETIFTIADIDHTLANLDSWVKPRRVPTAVSAQPSTSKIISEPLGVVAIIAPWNYPVQLLLAPLVAAIAAGNAAVLKPSEIAPATDEALGRLIDDLNDPAIAIVQGGVTETTRLLEQRFDHILYTGNSHVARIVMRAAAENLTPVTLELGGKSPVVVTRNANVAVAAKRIAWGKFLNAGQTCIAPDYVLAERSVREELVNGIREAVRSFYGADPRQSPDLARIVNEPHFHRIEKLMQSGKVVIGGESDADDLYIAPTVLVDVNLDDPVMGEEIFGPVLPIIDIDSIDEAEQIIKAGEKPLAMYVFSEDSSESDALLAATSSGGACVNAVIMHVANPYLPFGGVGESGTGSYHGRAGFDTFSHHRSVMSRPTKVDPPVTYPPYTAQQEKLVVRAFSLPDPRDLLAKARSRVPFL